MMLQKIQACFRADKALYSKHARDEMENEEFGEIQEREIHETVLSGKIIENYPEDEPYPSCLIYGRTLDNRPIHVVGAYSGESDIVIVITAYQPDPERWIDFERRKT